MTSRASQRERILELLLAARSNWVSLPKVRREIENLTAATASSFPEFGNLAREGYGVD